MEEMAGAKELLRLQKSAAFFCDIVRQEIQQGERVGPRKFRLCRDQPLCFLLPVRILDSSQAPCLLF